MLQIKRTDDIPNSTVYGMTQTELLINSVRKRQLKFLGPILRWYKNICDLREVPPGEVKILMWFF